MTIKPFFSVCVAIYNIDQYLYECLNSLKSQSFQDVEFILIDDCSTDKSLSICKHFCNLDNRFRLIHHEKNLGLLRVRKTGIKESNGLYTLFIDGDDYYTSKESLKKIYNIINEYNNVDIIRFECECIGDNLDIVKNVTKHISIKSKNCILDSFSALESIYEKMDNAWNLWCHAFKTQVLKNIIDVIPDEHFILAEDAFLLFMSIYSSKNYGIYHSGPLYSYRIGSGVSTKNLITLYHFREMTKQVRITKWIDAKLHIDNCEEKYFRISSAFRHFILRGTAYNLQLLKDKDKAYELDMMANEGYIPETITAIREVYNGFDKIGSLARNLYNSSSLRCTPKTIKTIGILYQRYYDGGVERVISLQIPMFMRLGYQVVLFTEEINQDIEYPLPAGVRRVLLPRYYEDNRANALKNSLQKECIDVLLDNEFSSENILWDVLLTKLIHIPVVITFHNPCWGLALWNTCKESFLFEYARPYIYRLSDYLIILNSSFKKFFEAYGCRTIFIPNPHTFNFEDTNVPKLKNRSGVLWLGRLDDSQKHWRDALYVMEQITKLVPGTQCYIGGSEYDANSVNELKEIISQHHLEQYVHWIGRRTDVKQLLQHCRVFLMTSSFEAFPMILAEAKICGAPVVIYEMPYLEMLQDPKGVLIVPQRDTKSMIEKSIRLLRDNTYCERLIQESRQSAEIFYSKYDLIKIWKKIFDSFNMKLIPVFEDKSLQQCFDFLLNVSEKIYTKESIPQKNSIISFYNNLTKCKRLLFIIFFDRGLLKQKVKGKFYRHPIILNIMKFCYKSMRNIYNLSKKRL